MSKISLHSTAYDVKFKCDKFDKLPITKIRNMKNVVFCPSSPPPCLSADTRNRLVQTTSWKMEKLVGAVQDTLESGARALDSAINDINQSTANPARHPQRLARLVAPQLLVIQSPVYRQLLLYSSLVATKAAVLAATLEFLRLARGGHRFLEDAEAFGGNTISSDAAVNRLEAALAQVKATLNVDHVTG